MIHRVHLIQGCTDVLTATDEWITDLDESSDVNCPTCLTA